MHPRDTWHTLLNARIALREIRRVRPTAAFSTGSGVSLAWLPVAAAFGAKAHFIDSATRITGPSLCGRLLTPVPGIQVYSQYESWAKGRIAYGGSVFDGFTAVPGGPGQVRRVLVTVGSNETYGFERLINRLIKILPADAEVIWQIGCSNVDGLGIDGKPAIPLADMVAAHDWADIVVAHAGVGSAMIALEHGRVPVLIPRRKAHNEHIDDHQTQIARELGDRGLAVTADADELTLEHLEKAASMRVTTADRIEAVRTRLETIYRITVSRQIYPIAALSRATHRFLPHLHMRRLFSIICVDGNFAACSGDSTARGIRTTGLLTGTGSRRDRRGPRRGEMLLDGLFDRYSESTQRICPRHGGRRAPTDRLRVFRRSIAARFSNRDC